MIGICFDHTGIKTVLHIQRNGWV